MKRIPLLKLQQMKKEGKPVAWVTCYNYPFAVAAEAAGVDMILVGDSGGMVELGYATTNPVTMDEMIVMAKAVRRGAPNTFVIGDMPQGSYEVSPEEAVRSALRFVKEADCDAVKLEGGLRCFGAVEAIHNAGILVMGHLGLTPQSAASFGGYRVQGKTPESFRDILENATVLQHAGVFSLLLEAMPAEPAGQIAKHMDIPVYGIGVGNLVDGQLLIMYDLLGLHPTFLPHFAKDYIPQVVIEDQDTMLSEKVLSRIAGGGLLKLSKIAIQQYVSDVRNKKFPSEEYTYPILAEELIKLQGLSEWQK
jgi:3-methyl-2-oxobutanoate hydroxymethyltransferase